jgi:hypothetical protein
MTAHRRYLLLIVLALMVSAPLALGGPLATDGLPPAGCWTSDGGGPARTAEARGPGIRGALESAWTFETKGTIEGEPLVWGPRVLISVRDSESCRTLHLLRLADGVEVGSRTFETRQPLLTSVWDGVVLLRSAPRAFQALALAHDSLSTLWTKELPSQIRGLLITGRQVWVSTSRAAFRFELGAGEPTWTADGGWRGSPSLRGDRLYLVRSIGRTGRLVALHHETGEELSAARGSDKSWPLPGQTDPRRIAVYEKMVMVHTPNRMGRGGGTLNLGFATQTADGAPDLTFSWLWELIGDSVRWEDGWTGLNLYPGEKAGLTKTHPDGTYFPLAIEGVDHTKRLWPSRVGSLVYFGNVVADIDSEVCLGSLPGSVTGRVVPLTDTLLVPRAPGTIEALVVGDGHTSLFFTDTGPRSFSGRVVLASGAIVPGAFEWDEPSGGLRLEGKKAAWPPSEILVALDADGGILACGSLDSLPAGLAMLDRAELAAKLADLANRARSTRDPELLDRLIFKAVLFGATEKAVAPAVTRLERIRSSRHPQAPIKSKVLAIEKELATFVEPQPRGFEDLLESLGNDVPPRLRIGLLRRVLAENPSNKSALEEVRAMLPEGLTLPAEFPALSWLEFLDVAARCPVKVLVPPKPGELDLPPGRRMLGVLGASWRPDLIGVESEQLLVLTPVDRPASVARCLSLGELVCSTLSSWFATGTHDRATHWPMLLLIHDSKREYREETARSRAGEGLGGLREHLGHYSPGEELSRMFVPGDESSFRTVMDVFAHELTHQWLEERCPLVGGQDRGRGMLDSGGSGFFIVEGMATLMEEFVFDLEARTARLRSRPRRPFIVAAAGPDVLLPWETFYDLGHEDFVKLSEVPNRKIPANSICGEMNVSEISLFYAQACATTIYLFAGEEGRHREKLMEYVGAYYRGDAPKVKEYFGMPPAELGGKARGFIRELLKK